MPQKKKTTKRQKAKRDLIDLVKDACRENSPLVTDFFNELNKEGLKAKDFHKLLISWGYDGVSLKDCTKLIAMKASTGEIKPDWMRRAYQQGGEKNRVIQAAQEWSGQFERREVLPY